MNIPGVPRQTAALGTQGCASGVQLKPSSTLGIIWGRAGARKPKPPPTCSSPGGDGKAGSGSFCQNAADPENKAGNKQVHRSTCWGAWKCEPQGKRLRLSLGQAEVRAGQGAEESKDREFSLFPFLALEPLWAGIALHCGASSPLLSPGCWPCVAQGGLCPAPGKESCVCSELLCRALWGYLLWVKNSGQLRFTGLFCKYCVL